MKWTVISTAVLVLCLSGCRSVDDSNSGASHTNWPYQIVTETSGAKSYIFGGERKPLISLGGRAALYNYNEVNVALHYLKLPPIDCNVPELESTTGSRAHRGVYRWDDYPLGVLEMRRTTGRIDGKSRDLIWKITIKARD